VTNNREVTIKMMKLYAFSSHYQQVGVKLSYFSSEEINIHPQIVWIITSTDVSAKCTINTAC